MQELLSQTARDMKPSVIRALLKLVQQSDVISFAGGTPDAELFPRELLASIASRAILDQGRFSLQYGETIGWGPLREQVAIYLRAKGIACDTDQILITTGSQQGLALASMVMLDAGDTVLVENPSYLGALLTFRNFKGRLQPVDCDDEGLLPAALEAALKQGGRKPKFLYLIPTFQNPAGSTMPQARRKEVMDIARKHGLFIVEDDPYGELNFSGAPIQPLKAQDASGEGVAYIGTFSKICSPGMRLGWVCAPQPLIKAMTMAKETMDVCTDVLSQVMAAEFFQGGHLAKHLDTLVDVYRRRRDVMVESIRQHFPAEVRTNKPQGGFFLWARLPQGFDSVELFKQAIERKVAYVVGTAFHAVEGEGLNTLRLCFCAVDEAKIREGIQRLGGVFKAALERAKV